MWCLVCKVREDVSGEYRLRLPSAAWSLKSPEPHAYMRAHRTPARRPYMAGGAARRAWPEESGRGVDRDGVLTAGRTAGPREGGPGLPLRHFSPYLPLPFPAAVVPAAPGALDPMDEPD